MRDVASVVCKSFFALLFVLSFTSCATMFSGTKADIFIDGDVDEPVTINSSAGEYKDVTLPTMVEVKRRQLNGQHIHISSEHHSFDDIVLEKAFNEWALLSALTSVTPLVIDLMTNAVSRPKYDQFFITPTDNQPVTDSLRKNGSSPLVSPEFLETRTRLRTQQLPENYPRHEINATLGFGPNQADRPTQRFVDDITLPRHMEIEGMCGDILGDSYGMVKLEYHYRLNRRWDIGAMMACGVSKENYTNEYYYAIEQHKNEHDGIITTGYQDCRSFSFAPSVRYTWYETRSYRLFSRVSLGMMRHHLDFNMKRWKYDKETEPRFPFIDEERVDEVKWRMAYQLSAIGISVGSPNLRFFAELGYGCLGVFHTGLCVCF